jgi:PAS domain S-box-containing protein
MAEAPGEGLTGGRTRLAAPLAIIAGLIVVQVAFVIGGIGRAELRAPLSSLVMVVIGAIAIILVVVAARGSVESTATRRAWTLIALAVVGNLLGDTGHLLLDLAGASGAGPSIADLPYGLFYLFVVLGVASFPRRTEGRIDWAGWLDMAIITLAGGLLLWDLVLGPAAAAPVPDPLTKIAYLVNPAIDLLVVAGIARIATVATLRQSQRALVFLLLSMLAMLAGDVTNAREALFSVDTRGTLVDVLWSISLALLAIAAAVQVRDRRPGSQARRISIDALDQVTAVLPYALVAAAFGLAIEAALRVAPDPEGLPGSVGLAGLVIGAAIITGLAAVRQFRAMRHLAGAERTARRLERRYRALAQNGRDLVFIVDDHGRITYASPSVATVLGREPAALLARQLTETLDPGSASGARATLEALAALRATPARAPLRPGQRPERPPAREATMASLLFVRGGHRPVEHEVVFRDLTDDPAVRGIVVTAHDVSDARGLIRSLEARYQNVVDAVREVVFEMDAAGRYTFLSPAWAQIMGYPVEESLGRMAWEFAVPDGERPPAEPPVFSTLSAPWDRTVRGHAADGSERWIEIHSTALLDAAGRRVGMKGVMRDITAQRHVADALTAAKDEAERANRAKSDFLSRMSHELRTPLNSILGFGELLQLRPLETEDRASIDRMVAAGRHLLDLINDVLDIARIETDQLELVLEPVEVHAVVADALALVRPFADQRGIGLDDATGSGPDGPPPSLAVLADRPRLLQVLLNLLSNAIKYNRPNGLVRVSVETDGDGWARILVADTGPGIPALLLPRLFTPFDRLGAELGSVEGTGLGLSVVKRLVDGMKGRVDLDTDALRGTTFRVELPIAAAAALAEVAAAPAAAGPVLPPIRSRSVLVVEDNEPNRELLERILRRMGDIDIATASTGAEALRLASNRHRDLVLLDLGLPDMDGAEVLQRLLADPETRDVPIAVLSADATDDRQRALLEAGAVRYLTKPFNIAELMEAISQMLAEVPVAR